MVRAEQNQPSPSMRSKNFSAGREIEQSSPENDLGVRMQQETSNQELARILKTEIKPEKTVITSDMGDIRKELNIIDDDASEVAKVRPTETTGTKNTSGVQIKNAAEAKRPVISQDGQQVKETHYNAPQEEESVRKRLVVDKEASGVEVRKTGTAAKTVTVVKATPKKVQVIKKKNAVMETSYGKQKSTDVGSSTQPKVEADVIMKSKATPAKSSKIIRDTVDNDAVVVSKVSKARQDSLVTADNPVINQGGITAKLTVGPEGTVDTGEVQFSSSGDGIELGDVTIGDSRVNKTVLGDDSAAIIDDGDIDVDDILGNMQT